MSVSRQTTDAYELERVRPSAASDAPLQKVWRRYVNSSIPLGLKWSLSIAALIVMSMGLLGSYLIQQQEASYRGQFDRFSEVIVDQFVRISGEPLMAGDALSLQVLLQRHVQSHLILGAALHDAKGERVVEQGVLHLAQLLVGLMPAVSFLGTGKKRVIRRFLISAQFCTKMSSPVTCW